MAQNGASGTKGPPLANMLFLSDPHMSTQRPVPRPYTSQWGHSGVTRDGITQDLKADAFKRVKRQPTEWEKRFSNHISNKNLVFRTHKELSQLNKKNTNDSIFKWAKDQN